MSGCWKFQAFLRIEEITKRRGAPLLEKNSNDMSSIQLPSGYDQHSHGIDGP